MNEIRRVLIAGGGVGGLAAALAFAQRGVAVTLIEKRPDFDVPGVGLGQPANALRVYDALGVLDQILGVGYIYDHMTICDANRRTIAPHKFLLGDERVPAVCALPRSDLHDILLRAATKAGVTVRLGLHVTEIDEEQTDRACVIFSDGSADTFDLMAGFDGIRSMTRTQLFGTAFVPRYSGFGAWRVQVPRREDVTGMEFLQSTDGKVGAMPIGPDTMYLFNIRPEPEGVHFPKKDMARLWRERLAGFGGYVAEIRDSLNEDSDIVYSPIEPLMVPWPWHRGRVVIGGDAAHVVPPHLTQGAAMAVEDAFILAHEIMNDDNPVEARLMQYAQQRYGRSAFVYIFSSQWLEMEQAVRTPEQMEAARRELALNGSSRIAASDRILNTKIF
jgi:2-polyprenyl-6-methoxyphenol hydroxylase-like FAD-dependent oxidoreductase